VRTLVVHFRSAPASGLQGKWGDVDPLDSLGTDGVSLEIAKRKTLLEMMGHNVAICSAYDWADFPIPALEFDSEEIRRMTRNLFGPRLVDFKTETDLRRAFDISCLDLKQELMEAIESFEPGILFVHNILSLPVHPAATVALTQLLRETQLPCAAIHHDVLSEGAYKFTPTCNFAKSILDDYFPPTMPNLRHWTINSRNQRSLRKKGIEAKVIHDTMDFDQKPDASDQARIRMSLRAKHGVNSNDIVLFVGARIVPNKQIELAGHLTAVLQSLRQEVVNKKLYHGGVFSEESRLVLALAGRPERGFADYRERLFQLFDDLRIDWMYVGDEVRPIRSEKEGFYALYPDMYAMADFVLYPTGWEGFGNQLLEAFAAGLPVAVFEYLVFKEDIAPKGVKVLSLGDTILEKRDPRGLTQVSPDVLTQVAHEMIAILTDRDRFRSIAAHNISVARRYFSFNTLRTHLNEVIAWALQITRTKG